MVELWDLVDINKDKTGVIHERGKEDMIPHGMYHIVVEVWTRNSNNKVLLTRRHPKKIEGLSWEGTCGSVILGEESIDGAMRELYEETGIKAKRDNMIFLGDTIRDNYIIDTYLYILEEEEPKLTLQPEEVVDAKFVTFSEMEKMKDNINEKTWSRFNRFKDRIFE